MRSTSTLLAAVATISIAFIASGRGEEPVAPGPTPSANAPQATADNGPVHMPADETPDSSAEKWRFRQHQGLWWYWLPSEKWVYWHAGKWVPYDPASYAELRQTMPVRQQTYYRGRNNQGSSGYPELGEWGRVRYDSYGNRQYPYSMRRSGIRQLGPVPAMGGVRSLPGWGGER